MVIHFDYQNESEIPFVHQLDPQEIDFEDEAARIVGQTEIIGAARRGAGIAHLKGNLRGRLELDCSRCLQPSLLDLNAPFEVDFVTPENYGAATDGGEKELSAADLSLSIYDGEQIDLNEIVREQILLNVPMQKLCREDCLGLCEKCGGNRNLNLCDCQTTEIDPRWSALKKIINKS